MPRISKVSFPKMKLDYGYLFDIQNYDDLQGWWDNVRTPKKTQAQRWKEAARLARVLICLRDQIGEVILRRRRLWHYRSESGRR